VKRFSFLLGAVVGFVLGSRAGRGPYLELETQARSLMKNAEIKRVLNRVKGAAKNQATSVAHKVGDKLPLAVTSLVETQPSTEVSYADRHDLQFGKAGAEKEETLDTMLDMAGLRGTSR